MQLTALSYVLGQLNLRKHLFWKLPEPSILTQNLQLLKADTGRGRYEEPNHSDQGWDAKAGLGMALQHTWFRNNGELRGLS